MKKPTAVILLIITIGLSGCRGPSSDDVAAAPDSAPVADAIYTNGKIYTVNEAQPWAEAVAIKDGKFITVGSADQVAALAGDNTEVVDLGGAFVMPGVFDLHAHPFITPWYGSMNLELTGAETKEKVLAAVAEYAEANPDKECSWGVQGW